MAKISFSATIDDIRGKVGNGVFTASRSGAVLRSRAQIKNPRTAAQTSVRSNLSRASAAFKNMTTAQVQAWAAYASGIVKKNPVNGKAYNPTANTIFIALTSKFLQATPAGAIPMTPPTSAFAGDSAHLTSADGDTDVTFSISAPNAPGITTELLVQKLVSKNRTPAANAYRSNGFHPFVSGALQFDVPSAPGVYAPAYRFVSTQTGQDSGLVVLPVITVG